MAFETTRLIDWGDCDAAGIVFYPNFFRWMDSTFHEMSRATGFGQRRLREAFGLLGTPLLGASADFRNPASYGETLAIAARVSRIGRTSFDISYAFTIGAREICTGQEARVVGADGPSGLEAAPIPAPFRTALEELCDG